MIILVGAAVPSPRRVGQDFTTEDTENTEGEGAAIRIMITITIFLKPEH